MRSDTNNLLFCEYYAQWIEIYKRGAIREATMAKYLMTQKWVEKLIPELKVSELTRTAYQKLLNDYAKDHERQTTLDFHHQLKGAILDAVDEGMIERDPTRKAIIKGKTPRVKKIKYLNQFELHTLIDDLDIGSVIYPKYITSDSILRYVRAMQNTIGGNVETLYHVLDNQAEALEFIIRDESPVVGIPLADLNLKPNLLVCCLTREGTVRIPRGQDSIQIGDNVIIVTTHKGLRDIRDILA